MAGLYDDAFLDEIREGARGVVGAWGLSPRTEVSLLNISENATFRADDPEGDGPVVLRVHRPDYHTRQEIESELDWIADLRAERIVETPAPLEAQGGGHIASFEHHGETRYVVAFSYMSGKEPDQSEDLVEGFFELGAINARLHGHVRHWTRPAGFQRKIWNFQSTVGDRPLWGDWRAGLGLEDAGRVLLERTATELKARLDRIGEGPERFGLIHADLRLANLLVDGDRLGVIDFDDCGFSWYGYDFAAAVSFLEHEPQLSEWQDAWVRGYRSVEALSAEEEAVLPTFVMLRRLLLTAWIASHAETPTAQEMGVPYTEGTLMLADRFLSSVG